MTTITENLNLLFKEWEDSVPDYKNVFVGDGIINETEWNKTFPKILFIAKEANQFGTQRFGDFREDWKGDEWQYPFAYRIAEWSFGIIKNFPLFNEIYRDYPQLHEMLQKVSFLNIKKNGGASSCQPSDLEKHFDENQLFLNRELELINPNIIILGLSFNLYIRAKMFDDVDWKDSGYDIYVAKCSGRRIIDFYHPSSRNSPPASYSLLQNVFNSKVFKEL